MQPKDILPYLYKAVRNREHHQQQKLNCGTACCVAGDIATDHYPELVPYLADNEMGEELEANDLSEDALYAWEFPWKYSETTFGLNPEIAELIFFGRSTVYSHLLAIFLIENGLQDSLYAWTRRADNYIYNTLEFPFYTLVVKKVDYSDDLSIQDLLDTLANGKNSTISPELQALLDEVKESVPA